MTDRSDASAEPPPPDSEPASRGRWSIMGGRSRRAGPSVDPAELNANRERATAASLPLLAGSIGVMLLLSAFFRLHPLDSASGMISAGVSGLAGGAMMITAFVLSRRGSATDNPHPVACAILLVATVTLCVSMLATGSLDQTAYVELLVVVTGAVMMRPRWFVLSLASVWALWLAVTAALSGRTDGAGWTLAMLGATVVAVVVLTMRTDALRALGTALLAAESEAVRDPLTGLLNRRGLEVVGHEVLALGRRAREPLSCTFIDVDGLKDVNDEFGHEFGDTVLRGVADALSHVFRQADVLARWGGDEFIVLSLGPGPRVEDVERRLNDQLVQTEPALSGRWAGTVSAGRIVHMPWQDEDLQEITSRADQEMYRRRRLRRAQIGGGGW